jgi:hypothetical protein
MSRSSKSYPEVERSWLEPEPCDQPGTEKAGARRRAEIRPRSPRQGWLLAQRRRYGSTEKILHRKTWTRLVAKEGRRLDKAAVQEGMES